MKLKTTTPVSIAQARTFEDEQGVKGIKKLNIFSQLDCKWEVEIGKYTFSGGFGVPVKWFQLQEYETGDPENPTAEIPVLMFSEDFRLDETETQQLWQAVGTNITTQDNLKEKLDGVVLAGCLHWIGNIRQIFGLGPSGFEVVEANRPALLKETERMNEVSKKKT